MIHCGDLSSPPIVQACAVLPLWFALGNHDSDSEPLLQRAAIEYGAICLGWGGVFELAGKRIGVTHGHMTIDMRKLLAGRSDYLFLGHSHLASDARVGEVRRINPGALHRADEYTVALLNTTSGQLKWLQLPE